MLPDYLMNMIAGIDAMMAVDVMAEKTTLTGREREVVALLCEGLTNVGIAHRLGTSENTVRNQISMAYRKMGVSSRVAAVVWWMKREGREDRIRVEEKRGEERIT